MEQRNPYPNDDGTAAQHRRATANAITARRAYRSGAALTGVAVVLTIAAVIIAQLFELGTAVGATAMLAATLLAIATRRFRAARRHQQVAARLRHPNRIDSGQAESGDTIKIRRVW